MTQLQVYRLAAKVDALRRPEDFREMAQLAIEQGSPGEAQRILEKGFAKNLFSDQRSKDQNTRLLEQAKKLSATDQAQLPKLEKDAESAGSADKLVSLGVAFFSYQQYPKAVEAFKKAFAKGGVRNEGEVRLLLGISQLMASDKDGAVQSFKQVKGDPKLARIANLWALHARQS
jgi:tetratricopeptide (TPR) repeat protein